MPTMSLEEALELAAQHHRSGRLDVARGIYERVLAHQADHPVALHLLGALAAQQGHGETAIKLIRKAIAVWPTDVNFHSNLATILQNSGNAGEAAEAWREAVKLAPDRADLRFNWGNMLRQQNRLAEAVEQFEEVLRLDPRHVGALNNLGNSVLLAGKVGHAVEYFRRALDIDPANFGAAANLGAALRRLKLGREAIQFLQRAAELNPADATVRAALGDALSDERAFAEAAICYREAARLEPGNSSHVMNQVLALWDSDQLDDAIAACRELIQRSPSHAGAWAQLGVMLRDAGQIPEALEALKKAVDLDPWNAELHGKLIYMKFFHPPVTAVEIRGDLAAWNARHMTGPGGESSFPNEHVAERRLRIGYVSADFCEHVVGRNILPLFRNHDHDAFEIFCYSNNTLRDARTEEFRNLAHHFDLIAGESDEQAAARIRNDRIDILVDLGLHTGGNRLGVFARKAAPVQATFAGYPGSTGLPSVDYRITDPWLDPPRPEEEDRALYAERPLRLSASFWCFDPHGESPEVGPLPALARRHITFGCLNNFCKVNPEVLRLWARVMAAMPDSRLMLLAHRGTHRDRTIAFLQSLGIAPGRVQFQDRRAHSEYLRLYRQVDIALDTFPCNGHVTSLDCFYMGVPVVTQVGATLMGRAGLSQLMNMGLPELIAHSADEYVEIAGRLARDVDRLAAMRAAMRGRMEGSPLMDAKQFARDIESLYREMWSRWVVA